jgi:uncharacterized metal-binding protein YceD (DUF177 family)
MSKTIAPPAPHGFRRLLAVRKVGDSGLVHSITANAEECAGIAAFLDVLKLTDLRAEFRITRWRSRGLKLEGTLDTRVEQACVVTLEPVESTIHASFERRFLPADMIDPEGGTEEVFVDPEGEDPPEPLTHELDLGEVVVEELALNLDPYPRKPGIAFEDKAATPAEPKANPFAKLARLKPKVPPGP